MNYKLILIIGGLIIAGILGYALYNQLTRTTETYKAKEQVYNSSEPHFYPLSFGCMRMEVRPSK